MKKTLFAGFAMLGALSLAACENTDRNATTERDGTVVDRDSVATEYEVTETVVEYDTTTRTEKVDVDRDNNKRDNR